MKHKIQRGVMSQAMFVACVCLAWMSATCPEASAFQASATPAGELVTKYCVACHNQKLKTAGLALDKADAQHVSNSAETWEKVIVKLRSRSMPPTGIRRPDNATYDAVAGVAGIGT